MNDDDSRESATVSVTVHTGPLTTEHYSLARSAIQPKLLIRRSESDALAKAHLRIVGYDADGTLTHATYVAPGVRLEWHPPTWWPASRRDKCEVWRGDGTADA